MGESKETKVILKQIRESIKGEKYRDAIQKCEELLKTDPKNHMAYLLQGAAFQHVDKSKAAISLKKSIELTPGPPTVALQGLATCSPVEELPAIYEKLIELLPDKTLEYYEKIFGISVTSSVAEECFNSLKRECKRNKNVDEDKYTVSLKYAGRLWVAKDFAVQNDDEELFKTCLESLMGDTAVPEHLSAYKRYLKLLYKHKDYVNCLKHSCRLIESHPSDVYAYEWLCKIWCEQYESPNRDECLRELKEPIENYTTKLQELNENSSLALLVQAFGLNEKQQFVAARDILARVLQIQPNYGVALKLLARVQKTLGAYSLASKLWEQLGDISHLEYLECLSFDCDIEKITEAFRELSEMEQTDDMVKALARCHYKLKNDEILKTLNLDTLSKAEFTMPPSEAMGILQSSGDLECFDTLLLLGKLQLSLGMYNEALSNLLKATRLRPYRSDCFYYLGRIYYATNDIVRARKCFEKCINLNPASEEAVNNLSGIYQQLGEEDLNVTLLQNTLKYVKSEASMRIHYKMGLHYLHVKRNDEAIQAFRTAIKYDVSCMLYWESLGDAYAERGSYNSAKRVFQKILEMDATNTYAKLQIALLSTTIRMYTEAIEVFDELLQEQPDYLPALKGAAEAHIGLANNLKSERRYGRCKDHLQKAVEHLQRVFLVHSGSHEMVWLWRLTANVFLDASRMPKSIAHLNVSGKLAKRDTEMVCLMRKDLLNLAIRFYTCALKLKNNTHLWYELALCSYYAASFIPDEAVKHFELSVKSCKMAIKVECQKWQNWNLLGVLYMHKTNTNLPMAQHCFIQALQLERKSYTAWTNLGVLYLHLNEIKLANQAFQRAQQSSPIYHNAWIGQSMIAEAIGEREEALDLFRHCQQFDYHSETALGYAYWVCDILTNKEQKELAHNKYAIETMYADVLALEAVDLYVANEEDEASVEGLSFQGFLMVRQKLYRPAEKAYVKAIAKAPPGETRDRLLTNLGFLYLKLKQPNEAISTFNMVAQADLKPIIGLALAYVHAGQHQEAYSIYNSVLKSVADTDPEGAGNILLAMASMVYASQGEADTKTILYQCILLEKSLIQALYAACALGILHKDNALTDTILSELKQHENCEEYIADVAFLTGQYHVANNNPCEGLRYIMSRVHIFPQCSKLRSVLANYILDNFPTDGDLHIRTSQIALSAIQLMQRSKSVKSDCIAEAKTLLLASRALKSVDKQKSHAYIQNALHIHPENQNARTMLLEFN